MADFTVSTVLMERRCYIVPCRQVGAPYVEVLKAIRAATADAEASGVNTSSDDWLRIYAGDDEIAMEFTVSIETS